MRELESGDCLRIMINDEFDEFQRRIKTREEANQEVPYQGRILHVAFSYGFLEGAAYLLELGANYYLKACDTDKYKIYTIVRGGGYFLPNENNRIGLLLLFEMERRMREGLALDDPALMDFMHARLCTEDSWCDHPYIVNAISYHRAYLSAELAMREERFFNAWNGFKESGDLLKKHYADAEKHAGLKRYYDKKVMKHYCQAIDALLTEHRVEELSLPVLQEVVAITAAVVATSETKGLRKAMHRYFVVYRDANAEYTRRQRPSEAAAEGGEATPLLSRADLSRSASENWLSGLLSWMKGTPAGRERRISSDPAKMTAAADEVIHLKYK